MKGCTLTHLILMASIFFSPTLTAEIYKWLDDDGNTHYSQDRQGQDKASRVTLPKDQPAYTPPIEAKPAVTGPAVTGDTEASRKYADEQKTRQNSYQQMQKSARAAADKRTVDECKKRRDIYCDKGADEIRRIEREKAQRQMMEEQFRKRNPPIPRYTGNDIHIR